MSLQAALAHHWLRDNFYRVVSDFERARFEYSVRKSERRAAGSAQARHPLASARALANASASAYASCSIKGAREAAGRPNFAVQCLSAAASTGTTPAPNSVAKWSTRAPTPGREQVAANFYASASAALFTDSVSESGAGIREKEKLVQQHTNAFVPRLEPLAERADSDKLSADQMITLTDAKESEADDENEEEGESERESETESPDAPLIDWQSLREHLQTQPGSEGAAAASSTSILHVARQTNPNAVPSKTGSK